MYSVEVVGIDDLFTAKIAYSNVMIETIIEKIFPQIANAIRIAIQSRIGNSGFKHNSGALSRAVTVEIDKEKMELWVYNDERIAPWAIYQEEGVKQHKMYYLKGKTIPYLIVNGKFVFAKGKSNPKFVKITEESFNRTNPKTGKPSWENPGYPGKFFYRDGLVDALTDVQKEFEYLTFRIAKVQE